MNSKAKSGKTFSPEPVELNVEKLISGGLGLARLNGEAILIPGALPGETLAASLHAPAKGVRRGRILEIAAPSPFRIQPDCPLAGRCGGCDFIHVQPETALKLKSEAALSDMAEAWGLEISLVDSPEQAHYRTRATLHLGLGGDGKPGLGFYDDKRGLVEFDDCRLINRQLVSLAGLLRRWALTLPVEAATGAEFSLTLGSERSGAFIAVSPPPPAAGGRGRRTETPKLPPALLKSLEGLPGFLAKETPLPVGCFARPAFRGPLRPLAKSDPARLPVTVWPELNLTLTAGPGEFTQVNPSVNKLMVGRILELAAPLAPGRALDLYSGHGNIALPLARSGFRVTAVEDSPEGARSARLNGNGLMEILHDRSEKAVEQLSRKGEKFDLIVLDPPRAGARDLAPALAAMNPDMIIYVACHPAVLARDVPAFVSLGYRPGHLAALNMFPRTSHLETILALRRNI
ncbi:hypothetical protein C4J81_08850 [Deltaproteobacteria bacterium Smac51]|nr:hypothetical protein C4J81_08850 [Deltaproteobacteria bacterium Smac51]